MKKAVHFGAGNIGRGFIGEILFKNDFEITFIDVSAALIDQLNQQHEYEIVLAEETQQKIKVEGVCGINSRTNPNDVIKAIREADIVTTAVGPQVLPYIAELTARGIQARREMNKGPIDFIACENMIGGSQFYLKEVEKYLADEDAEYAHYCAGFPDAAVDRIVPAQPDGNGLSVTVEPFCEWVVEVSNLCNPSVKLKGVHYVQNLQPYIERKLFSVNTGHATVAYNGAYHGYKTIFEALGDGRILSALESVQAETRQLLLAKWDFTEEELIQYHETIVSRFANPQIVDEVTRVARTPLRKLGYDERFIRPIRELAARGLDYSQHLETVGKIFAYTNPDDAEAVKLQENVKTGDLRKLIKEVTQLKEELLIDKVFEAAGKYVSNSV
ncbi:mannitol-1-phosphate 5-dehydrogenase [Lactovum odontotermitis]